MIRTAVPSRTRFALPLSTLLLAAALVGCGSSVVSTLGPVGPNGSPATSPAVSGTPGTSATEVPVETAGPSGGASPTATDSSSSGPSASAGCTGSPSNLAFFAQAAGGMAWSVYCAVLPDRWYLESGSYRLANGGHLEVTYRGPDDAHVSIAEGNVCFDVSGDVEQCAPRDSVISPAALGDLTGALGRLSNGLVLDVDRGANPSWRVTGLGLSEADFTTICAAMIRVAATP